KAAKRSSCSYQTIPDQVQQKRKRLCTLKIDLRSRFSSWITASLDNRTTLCSRWCSFRVMSGIEIAGIMLGVVPVAFKAAVEAWRVLDDAISFDDDTEDLVIRLETIKAHLGIWAAKAGLTNGKLAPALVPLEELLERTLKRIRDLVVEVEQQGQK